MKHSSRYGLLACAVLTWISMPVLAESPAGGEQNVTTKDVVVEASAAKEAAKYESQSTTIITKEDIEKKQAKSLEDVIFSETGVTRTVDAMGRVGIAIRGADPRHTLMLIDGQPVMGSESKYMGGSDEAMRIGAENIERIEIIRGAATAKYGPDAIGGVINIITKAPADHPTFQMNAEARYHDHEGTDENKNTWPSNYYMRADSGKIGNVKFSVFGSKREVMPVYSSERGYKKGESWYFEDFKPSLRYYGDVKNIGATGEVEINKNNKIAFRVMSEKEDMERRNKSGQGVDALLESMQIFKRNVDRDTYALSYTGRNDKHDWKVDVNYGKMKETDTTSTTYYGAGHDQYSGKNTLAAVDWLEHKQLDVNATMNTQVNDQHLLTYGIGYTDERADGTRLKNAPKTWVKGIDPWAYDSSLWVPTGATEPDSKVHNYLFKQTDKGLIWDKAAEYYGSKIPAFTQEDAAAIKSIVPFIVSNGPDVISMDLSQLGVGSNWTGDAALQKKFEEFNNLLKTQNKDYLTHGDATLIYKAYPVLGYYGLMDTYGQDTNIKYDGKYYGQGFEERENQVAGGEARIQRRHAFIQDTWQVNDNTILTPVLRIDNSDLFGSEVTANLGMTHNLGGNPHRRLKINAGTGYAEPGMGELYYNWEMFGSAGGSQYGWYWIGNPNLQPEKSVNFDISVEGENNKTYAKASVFHNVIDDYMTSYFMGQLIDFNQFGSSYVTNADRIYSFKNIGKAEITGFEAEIQQKFNDKWSAKLGYAWLHAINKSDPDMPRQLLDRPQHKVDISLNYEDKAHGWRAALWGDYYIHMLDSNSVSTAFTKDDIDANGNWKKKDFNYQKKTFGIWNFMVEKDFGKDMTAYIGIDNLFNHRDDDRAYQDRTYRIGANIKFGYDGKAAAEKAADKAAGKTEKTADAIADNGTVIINQSDWFLTRPSDKDLGRKKGDVALIGDYRVRSNMWGGQDNAAMSLTTTGAADQATTDNMKDTPDHGLEQRLRLGVDAQIGDNTNLLVQGSSGNTIDTMYRKAEKRGLHDARLDRAELSQKANKWDFTVGRLTEKMGVTGYWFGKEYDGARITWTDSKNQIRIGYGDFSHSTGITDSAYSHQETALISRSATLAELLGIYPGVGEKGSLAGQSTRYPDGVPSDAWKDQPLNYLEKWNHAGQTQQPDGTWIQTKSDLEVANERLGIVQELNSMLIKVSQSYPSAAQSDMKGGDWYIHDFLTDTDSKGANGDCAGTNVAFSGSSYNQTITIPVYKDGEVAKEQLFVVDRSGAPGLRSYGSLADKSWAQMLDTTADADYGTVGKRNIYEYLGSVYEAVQKQYEGTGTTPFVDTEGKTLSKDAALDSLFTQFVGQQFTADPQNPNVPTSDTTIPGSVLKGFFKVMQAKFDPLNGAQVPIGSLPLSITVVGTELKHDVIPAIDRAAFAQFRHKFSDDFGVAAWYLRSFGEQYHKSGMLQNADQSWGTYDQDMDVASVFGLGAQWKLGQSRLSFDWGVNYSDTGRYFNGGRDEYGRYTGGGSAPRFWVLRADIGNADTDVPGSWNAFADYKYFQHGSFFGGNGTEALPDRYLDGIRSFTLGAGYVPAKNFLLEAFYTFGAKSTGQRDTLHGSESFELGDYTRIQATYKF
ncbi:TonB-dependent siderophore receptor [uncultured Megasphaera sp.]|uniref:TonB-dependent receptor plug domain-containing protein n=1 Tax=uncultured Megasphaera sp. TaxID=165188 RepID=UPI00265B39A3|nr:TonB-dependent receptor [uncultured Megasphaera sp.]